MGIFGIFVLYSVFQLLKGGNEEKVQISMDENVPFGDKRACFSQFSSNSSVEALGTLPGIGWDNLENEYAGMIIHLNFSKCRTTDDGKYLLPDNVFTIPIKSSKLEIFGELFSHWTNYTSLTSTTINVQGGLRLGKFDISGKFSEESKQVRQRQEGEKSQTTRVQARYVRYFAKLEPTAPLSDLFVSRVKSIAYNLQQQKNETARYESELLVRDFGTHVVTSIDIGAVIAQISEIKSSFFQQGRIDVSKAVAAAGISFSDIMNINIAYNQESRFEYYENYEKHKFHSVIKTYGGPVFKPNAFSINEWASKIDTDVVAVNRNGYPIYELITQYNLPDIPLSLMYKVENEIKSSVNRYYKYNTYKGCTNPDSPNFSHISNVDDGSCEIPYTNFSFGGVYTECQLSKHGMIGNDLCSGVNQSNPLTGTYSCPNGYEAIRFNWGKHYAKGYDKDKSNCPFEIGNCDIENPFYKYYTYNSYWCVAKRKVQRHSGFLFGGVFTSTVNNLVTQDHSCPSFFYQLKMGKDFYVCVSDDYELGYQYSVPFGGFYSCKTGNPLAITLKSKSSFKIQELLHSMESYLKTSDPKFWPKSCPDGYSNHLGTIDDSCEVSFCVKAYSFSIQRFPTIRKPPFMKLPTDAFVDLSNFSSLIISQSSHQNNSSNLYTLVGSLIAAAIVTVLLIVFVVYRIKKNSHLNPEDNANLLELSYDVQQQYDTIP